MSPSITPTGPVPEWLRALALFGLLALPVAWLGSLALLSGHWVTNLARVVGALIAAGLAWNKRGVPPIRWGRLIMAGIAGSLAVTGVSILVPVLGTWMASGWLMSGAVGGVMIGLGLLAMGGPNSGPTAG